MRKNIAHNNYDSMSYKMYSEKNLDAYHFDCEAFHISQTRSVIND